MSVDHPFKVIIIGAGLAGSLLANGLIRYNIDVQVYERLPQDTKREGYQIRLGAAALKGMRACLTPDQLQEIVKKFGQSNGSKSEAPIVYDKAFKKVLDLSAFPTYNKSAPISRVVLRDALIAPVGASGKIRYDCPFERYEILAAGTADEKVRVWFEGGTYDDCDIMIAADGSHSKINKDIGLNNIQQVTSHVSMIAKNELPTKRYLSSNPVICAQPSLVFDEAKTLYFCAYLPASAKKGHFDESISSSFFGCSIPLEHCPPDLAKLSIDEKWRFVTKQLEHWAPEYHQMLDLVRGCDLYVYQGRVSQRPGRDWRKKVDFKVMPELGHPRVWMLGDSMHAMLPNRGMGGNTALCDTATALPLLNRLARLSGSGILTHDDIVKACNEYEAEMIPRAFEWVKKSGGTSVVPIDAGTISGRILFRLAAVAMSLAYYWYTLTGFFVAQTLIDEAPELA